MRYADVVILGGGIIGLSLAFELRKSGRSIIVLDRREPGREASHAAAGMLAPRGADLGPPLQDLALASAAMYPEFIQEIEDVSGMKVDLRRQGTILIGDGSEQSALGHPLSPGEQTRLEPTLTPHDGAVFLEEHSVDPRALTAAWLEAVRRHGVSVAAAEEAREVLREGDTLRVITQQTSYSAPTVVNCCGAWAGCVAPLELPLRPVKGHMLAVIPGEKNRVEHVIHAPDVYLVPRTDGRLLIGSTLEEKGFDKRVELETIQRLHQAADKLIPRLSEARIHEAWTGLRPATPDELPILSKTSIPGYFIAAGHFRNGILLAPITARLMTQIIGQCAPTFDLSPFAAKRFLQ